MEPKGYVTTTYKVTYNHAGMPVGLVSSQSLHKRNSADMASFRAFFQGLIRKASEPTKPKPMPKRNLRTLTTPGPDSSEKETITARPISKAFHEYHALALPRRVQTSRAVPESATKLESMINTCSEVQQSLVPLWQGACSNVTGSLQLLETSRKALNLRRGQSSWKTNQKYLKTRELIEKRTKLQETPITKPTKNNLFRSRAQSFVEEPETRTSLRGVGNARSTPFITSSMTPNHAKGVSDPSQAFVENEDEALLREIREFKEKEYDWGDTFKPVTNPPVSEIAKPLDPEAVKSMSDLNQFIFKERSKFNTKSISNMNQKRKMLEEAAMNCIEASPDVQARAEILARQEEKRRKRATHSGDYKKTALSDILKAWVLGSVTKEQQEAIEQIKNEERDLAKNRTVKSIFRYFISRVRAGAKTNRYNP